MVNGAERPARPDLRQGDVVELDGQLWVILSRSCDLVRDTPEHALLAPVEATNDAHTLRGWQLRQVRVPGLEAHVADIAKSKSVAKTRLPGKAQTGCDSESSARRFASDLSRSLGEASHPDALNKSVEPLWHELQHKRYRPGGKFHDLVQDILDVRVQTSPHLGLRDETSSRDVRLIFVIEDRDVLEDVDYAEAQRRAERLGTSGEALADTRDAWKISQDLRERALLLATFCEQLGARCDPNHPIVALEVEVESATSFSYARLLETDAIRVDRLSATPPPEAT